MKMKGNCKQWKMEHGKLSEQVCPFLNRPRYHAGLNGRSGCSTWWSCGNTETGEYMREIKTCDLAGDYSKQFNAALEFLQKTDRKCCANCKHKLMKDGESWILCGYGAHPDNRIDPEDVELGHTCDDFLRSNL